MTTENTNDCVGSGFDLEKCPTGIAGLDEITGGGLPRGRPTLVCGTAGCGKTLLGMECAVRGVIQYGEPAVFMSFEETDRELVKNVRSLGFDLDRLVAEKKFRLDHVRVERSEIEETGEYDLEGLFVRLGPGGGCLQALGEGSDGAGRNALGVGRSLKRCPPISTAHGITSSPAALPRNRRA